MLVVNGQPMINRIGDTILQTLESNHIQIFSECRSGYCGACRCKKVKGEPTLVVEPLAFANEDELLACISKVPLNGYLEITI